MSNDDRQQILKSIRATLSSLVQVPAEGLIATQLSNSAMSALSEISLWYEYKTEATPDDFLIEIKRRLDELLTRKTKSRIAYGCNYHAAGYLCDVYNDICRMLGRPKMMFLERPGWDEKKAGPVDRGPSGCAAGVLLLIGYVLLAGCLLGAF